MCGLIGGAVCAQEQTPASGPLSAAPAGVLQLDAGSPAGWVLEMRPTLSVLTGDGLRLSGLTVGSPFGVDVAVVEPALRAQLGIDDDQGVVVTAVADGSEAAKAGIQPHDVLLRIGGQPIATPEQFNETVAAEQGKAVTIQLLRRGQAQAIGVALPQTPHYELALTNQLLLVTDSSESIQHYRIGVTLVEADDTLRSQLRLAAGEGLIVTEVIGDGPAAAAGIRTHDVLVKLDSKRLSTVESINAQIQEIGEKPVALDYIRAGEEQTCEVTPRLSQGAMSRTVSGLLGSPAMAERSLFWDVRGHGTADALIQWLKVSDGLHQPSAEETPSTDAAAQIAEIQRQLDEISQAVNALGATLQAQSGEKSPAGESPEDQPEQPTSEE